jgi:phosphohistidine phosphatase
MDNYEDGYSLYIMRHGLAAERDEAAYPDDDLRPLTPKGEKKLQQIAAGLNKIDFEPDWIVASPLVRAKDTAAIIARCLDSKAPVELCDALRPESSPADLKLFLMNQAERRRVLLVGHEPDLSRLVAHLIGAGKRGNLAFKKGGCCLLQWGDHPFETDGQLVWWMTPRLLRALAGKS